VEVLSSQFQQAKRVGLLRGVPTSLKGPRLNNLFFADDSLLFCKASVSEWQVLTGILDVYEKVSGQRLNKEMTSVFFQLQYFSSLSFGITEFGWNPDIHSL
jgi:hypothetical protein